MLGQFIPPYARPEDLFESVEEGLFCILDDMKYEVFRAIKHDMDEAEVFAWMYCTGFTPIDPDAPPDDDDDIDDYLYEINSFEDYSAMIDKEIEEIVDSDMAIQKTQAFDYICSLMAK